MSILIDGPKTLHRPPLTADRQRMVAENRGLAYQLVFGRYRWAVRVLGPDEAEGYALFFLTQAAERWVPARGKFSTFVYAHFRHGFGRLWGELNSGRQKVRFREVPILAEGHGRDGEPFDWLHGPPDETTGFVETKDAWRRVCELAAGLTDREHYVLTHVYGLGGRPRRTYREIGDDLGISRTRVMQIHNRAVAGLRERLGAVA